MEGRYWRQGLSVKRRSEGLRKGRSLNCRACLRLMKFLKEANYKYMCVQSRGGFFFSLGII